ncbi:ribosome recycling factor-domain-containing protein [Thermothelomyces heterothallicus CBS 202.75]|uniref:ribosome recycling factor-domain-containing protein n=1 Tax=Thermothelomyces heterothallicus CBS 202.75 TaxID=1149848 RepID=UPI0037427836
MRPLRAANSMLRGIATGSASRRTTLFAVRHLSRATAAPTSRHIIVTSSITSPPTITSSNWPCRGGPQSRLFSHTPACQKKKTAKQALKRQKKNKRDDDDDDAAAAADENDSPSSSSQPNNGSRAGEADAPDPFDFGDLQAAFDRAEKRFAEELKKLRAGGRFNADAIGAIPVQPDKRSPQATFPLRELATVAPLGGRRWSILAFEEASVKAIIGAVQRSDEFGGQQPQRSADNPLELTITVEPERADALARRARDVCQAWRARVRDDAHRRAELHKKWRADGLLLSDDLHRLKEKLQKLQDERMRGIQAKEKEVVAAIMARG